MVSGIRVSAIHCVNADNEAADVAAEWEADEWVKVTACVKANLAPRFSRAD